MFFFFCSTLRIWQCSSVWTEFDKCHNLSKQNIKLILKILRGFGALRGSSNKKSLYSTRSCVNWALFGTRGPLKRSFHSRFKLAHSCQKKPNSHTNSLNKLLLFCSDGRKINCFVLGEAFLLPLNCLDLNTPE
jgi:hypothetical protein